MTVSAGITPRANALGFAWGDYDNDGFLDLYISRGKQSGAGVLANALSQQLQRHFHRGDGCRRRER